MESQVRALALARVALGVALTLAPGPILRRWFGPAAGGPMPQMLTRSVGGRDIALGLGTLLASEHGAPVRGWLEATMLADATDLVALVGAARHLAWPRLTATAVPTVAAIALGRRVVAQMAD